MQHLGKCDFIVRRHMYQLVITHISKCTERSHPKRELRELLPPHKERNIKTKCFVQNIMFKGGVGRFTWGRNIRSQILITFITV